MAYSLHTPNVDDLSTPLEHSQESPLQVVTEQNTSNIVTLKPFKGSGRPKQRRKIHPTLIHFDSLFGSDSWSRFLVMKTDSKITPLRLEYHLLKRCPTKEISFRSTKENEWLVETTTRQQSESLLSLTSIDGVQVVVTKHDNLNSIRGTVVLPTYDNEEEEIDKKMLLESLQMRYSNVEDLELYNIPNKKYPGSYLKIAKIKFQGQNLPSKIIVFGQNRELRPFVPSPLQCKNCSRYGHTAKKCLNQPVCAYCSSSDHETKWNCGQPRCINCGQDHHSRSKECCFHLYNAELKILQDRTGMSIKEAKLELRVRGFKDPSKNPLFKTKVQQNVKPDLAAQSQRNILSEKTKLSDGKTLVQQPNQYALLAEMEVEEESKEIAKDNMEDDTLNSDDKKRPLTRTPPKPKKQNLKENGKGNQSTRPKTKPDNETKRTELESQEIETKEEAAKEYRGDITDHVVTTQTPTKYETDDNKEIFQHKLEADIHANMSFTPSDIDKVKEYNPFDQITPSPIIGNMGKSKMSKSAQDISPSPIIGKTGQSFSKEKTSRTQFPHSLACGCNECFLLEFKKVKHINIQKANNLIDNFVRNKRKNPKNLESHQAGCLCIDHLLKKRAASNFFLENLIESIQQKESSEASSKEVTTKSDKSGLKSKQKSNATKISRNNTLPSENQQSSP